LFKMNTLDDKIKTSLPIIHVNSNFIELFFGKYEN